MRRTTTRLLGGFAALALALTGVATTAAPAHAADPPYVISGAVSIPGTTPFGTSIALNTDDIAGHAALEGFTIPWMAPAEWRDVSDDSLLGTGWSFTPTVDMVGTTMYATITAPGLTNGPSRTLTIYTSWTTITPGSFTQPTLSVTGTGIAGDPLSVTGSGWGATPTSYTWAWHRVSDNATMSSGSGATIGTYTVTAADVAASSVFYANVTAHLDGYGDATWPTSFSPTSHLGSFQNVTAVPTITGTGRLGTAFSASYDTAGITPAPTGTTIQWRTTDGTLVGTGTSFTPTNALLGQPLYATAVLTRGGYAPYTTLGSAFSATVALADHTPGAAPVISGRNVVGGTLTASVDITAWAPAPDSFSYQWFLEDGTAITGATSASLAMTADLVGEVVYVTATAHTVDHADYVIASAPTGRIAAPGITSSPLQAGNTVTIEAWGLLIDEEYTIELHSDPVQLGTVTSDAAGTIAHTVTLPASVPAGSHTLVLLHRGTQVAALAVTVSAVDAESPAPVSEIAATGADLSALPIGLALLALGALALAVAGRRSARRTGA